VSVTIRERGGAIIHWDERALNMVSRIEKSIVALNLDSQGQFIALTNAMEMQLESGAPSREVVRLLGEALLTLAHARRLPQDSQTDLAARISALYERVNSTAGRR
jgi:hypothetical protein